MLCFSERGEEDIWYGMISRFLLLWEHFRNSNPPPAWSLGNTSKMISWNFFVPQSISGILIFFSHNPAWIISFRSTTVLGMRSLFALGKQTNRCVQVCNLGNLAWPDGVATASTAATSPPLAKIMALLCSYEIPSGVYASDWLDCIGIPSPKLLPSDIFYNQK